MMVTHRPGRAAAAARACHEILLDQSATMCTGRCDYGDLGSKFVASRRRPPQAGRRSAGYGDRLRSPASDHARTARRRRSAGPGRRGQLVVERGVGEVDISSSAPGPLAAHMSSWARRFAVGQLGPAPGGQIGARLEARAVGGSRAPRPSRTSNDAGLLHAASRLAEQRREGPTEGWADAAYLGLPGRARSFSNLVPRSRRSASRTRRETAIEARRSCPPGRVMSGATNASRG